MLPFYLFALLGLMAFAFGPDLSSETEDDDGADDASDESDSDDQNDVGSISGDDDDGDLPSDDNPPSEEEDQPGTVFGGAALTGTDGDDVLTIDPDFPNYSGPQIDAGAGNDMMNLLLVDGADASPASDGIMDGAELYGGTGDDLIEVAASYSQIDGGAGDDVIAVYVAGGSTITGGDGNDAISGSLYSMDTATIYGGAGDDTIDARGFENAGIYGGEGDDTIYFDQPNQPGAGYVVAPDGGAGNDTLIFDGTAVLGEILEGPTALGGEGADTFVVVADETFPGISESGDDPLPLQLITIGDFEPGNDVLIVEPLIEDPDFTITGATLTEDTGAGVTTLTLHYEHPTEADRDLTITIEALGVTWSDITFEGENAPEDLIPLP